MVYDWLGNIWQFENVMFCVVVLVQGYEFDVEDFLQIVVQVFGYLINVEGVIFWGGLVCYQVLMLVEKLLCVFFDFVERYDMQEVVVFVFGDKIFDIILSFGDDGDV